MRSLKRRSDEFLRREPPAREFPIAPRMFRRADDARSLRLAHAR